MSEQKSPSVNSIPVWGVFLLFLGIVFLLQTTGVLPWGLWGTLWRFWPALLIAIGLGILLRRYNLWLVSVLILVLFFACLGIAIWQYGSVPPPGQTTWSYSESLDSVETVQLEIDFNAGTLVMSSLPLSSPKFVEAVSGGENGARALKTDFYRQDSCGVFRLSTERTEQKPWKKTRWEVRCTQKLPLTIDIKSAVGNLDIDLSELKITELHMDVDAGHCAIKMPSSAGTTLAYIKADVANVEVTIPDGVAVRLKAEVDLVAFEVDESRFLKKGDYYVSGDFDSASNRIELEIDCDIGRVQLK
ncbi:hypothetical protein ES703_93671 [subsurface metagenome]